MQKHEYTKAEKEAWKRGKIAAYYAEKARRQQCYNNKRRGTYYKTATVPKYSNFDAEKALENALRRSYESIKSMEDKV